MQEKGNVACDMLKNACSKNRFPVLKIIQFEFSNVMHSSHSLNIYMSILFLGLGAGRFSYSVN